MKFYSSHQVFLLKNGSFGLKSFKFSQYFYSSRRHCHNVKFVITGLSICIPNHDLAWTVHFLLVLKLCVFLFQNVPNLYDNCAFFFWFHTSFIENSR